MNRFIFHIDLNAFYATAEQIRNPDLNGLPVAVGGNRRRGVVTTCSYEARSHGVKSGMNASEAVKRCPNIIFVESDMAYYKEKSAEFFDFLKNYTEKIQKVSIDEAYLDLTEEVKSFDKPLDLAVDIQAKLKKATGLSCSIGISVNKFLAKMASDMRKPMGITIIRPDEIEYMIYPLPIEMTHGIGRKTAPLLKDLGIETIGDLVHYDDFDQLREILGKNTLTIINKIQGIGNYKLDLSDEIKSIGNSRTFSDNVSNYTEITEMFYTLAESVSERLKRQQKVADTITITIRTDDFKTMTRSKKLMQDIYKQKDIYEEALLLYDQTSIDRPIRLLGIACTNLKPRTESVEQLQLFGDSL